MVINGLKKFTSISIAMCLSAQSFAQFVPQKYNKPYTAAVDNTYVAKPTIPVRSDPFFTAEVDAAAGRVIALSAKGFDSKEQQDAINALGAQYGEKFYDVITAARLTGPKIYDKVYTAAMPILWTYSYGIEPQLRAKIAAAYNARVSSCVSSINSCDIDHAGAALLFSHYSKTANIRLNTINSTLLNQWTDENKKIQLLQYAMPIYAEKGGKADLEKVIENLAKQVEPGSNVYKAEFDPFAPIKAIDGAYSWIKETCTHKDGFVGGFCAAFKSGKAPFRQYKSTPVPPSVKAVYAAPKIAGISVLAPAATVKQRDLLSAVLRMYADFYSDEASWQAALKYLINFVPPSDMVIIAHRDIAIAHLSLNAPASVKDKEQLKLYCAARLNNDYFFFDKYPDIDAGIKAAVKNEIGQTYVALTGYKGASPITVKSDDGFVSKINFTNNEKQIEGFWQSMFNFKERPAEAVSNVFILGLITKGAIKNSNKIWVGITGLFKAAPKALVNIPAMMQRAKLQYKALKFLAAKNSMTTAEYAYKNSVYRSAARVAAKSQMNTVENRAVQEFFASSHYTPATHGKDIVRISKDVKQAAQLGVKDLGKGGTVKSHVAKTEYGNFNSYAQDLQKQQAAEQEIAAKYRSKTLVKAQPVQQPAAEVSTAANAEHSLPRSYMYDYNKAGSLAYAQNEAFAQEYAFNNQVYKGLQTRGFNFFDTKTGVSLGHNLTFHNKGFLQAVGRVGLSYNGGFSQAGTTLKSLTNVAAHVAFEPVSSLKGLAGSALKPSVDAFKTVSLFNSFSPAALKTENAFANFCGFSLMSINLLGGSGGTGAQIYSKAIAPFAKSTFKVSTTEGRTGSGFYIEYKKMPLILTSGHVMGSNKIAHVTDIEGKEVTGSVLSSTRAHGMDLAAIYVNPEFLAGREPFTLAKQEPVNGDFAHSLGYPRGEGFQGSILKIYDTQYKVPNSVATAYKTTAGDLDAGSSGSPLLLSEDKSKVAGVAYALINNSSDAVFIGRNSINQFLLGLSKRLITSPELRDPYLKLFPDFVSKYSNLIAKYGPLPQINRPAIADLPAIQKPILTLEQNVASIENLQQATLRIVRRSDGVGGSGVYINYRGLPAILTASHVVRDNSVVELYDHKNVLSFGYVFAKTPIQRGWDFALVIPEKGFLADKQPLKLATREPVSEDNIAGAGFPKDKWMDVVKFSIEDMRAKIYNEGQPVYKVTPAAMPGMSGGPLVLFGPNSLFGIAHMGSEALDVGYYQTLPELRKFLKSTLKDKFLSADFPHQAFLQEYPELADSYSNTLNRYSSYMGTRNVSKNAEDVAAKKTAMEMMPKNNIVFISDDGGAGLTQPNNGFMAKLGSFFGFKPKQTLLPANQQASASLGYPQLSSETFILDNLANFAPDLKIDIPGYPFEPNNINYFRGEAVDYERFLNLKANGLSSSLEINDMHLRMLPNMRMYGQLQGQNNYLRLSRDPQMAAKIAIRQLSSGRSIPVVVHTKDIPTNKDLTLKAVKVYISQGNIKPEDISLYSALLNINGHNTWGNINLGPDNRVYFKPYVLRVEPALPSAHPFGASSHSSQLGIAFESLDPRYVLSPKAYEKYDLPTLKSMIQGPLHHFDLGAYKAYFEAVRRGVVEIYNPLFDKAGTGFYLKKDNKEALLTASHLVEGSSTVKVRPAGGTNNDWYVAKVSGYSLNEESDIGLLEVADQNFWAKVSPLSLATHYPNEGEEILSYGFPWGIGFEERAGTFQGFLPLQNGNLIAATEHTAPGNSGGPILYNGRVVGMCKRGFCSETIAQNPKDMANITPSSYHTTWESLDWFLNKAVIETLPKNLQGALQNNPVSSGVLSSASKLLLNPRNYGIAKQFVLGFKTETGYDYGVDFAINNTAKKMGAAVLSKVFNVPARSALTIMYKYGAKPSYTTMPRFFERYEVDNLNDYRPDLTKFIPAFPYNANKLYLFRGMSLDIESLENINRNGLRLEDVGASNNNYLHTLYPGAGRYISAENSRTICFTEKPSEAGFYSMRYVSDSKPFPTVVSVKGVSDPNTLGFGVLLQRDVLRSDVVSINVLLNIDGVNTWCRLEFKDGKIAFLPYSVISNN